MLFELIFGLLKSATVFIYENVVSPLIFPSSPLQTDASIASDATSGKSHSQPESVTPVVSPAEDDDEEGGGHEQNKGAENLYESVTDRKEIDNSEDKDESEAPETEEKVEEKSSTDTPDGDFQVRRRRALRQTRSSAMDLVSQGGNNGRRSMWGELKEVQESGILGNRNL